MNGKSILIIDNRVKTRGLISRLFTEMGCETMTTGDRATGLAVAQHADFDLVILGANLPINADEFFDSVKEYKPDLLVMKLAADGAAPVVSNDKPNPNADKPQPIYPVGASLSDVERIHIERVLEEKRWNQSAAAQALGIDRKTLRNKMREFRLERS